MTEEELEKKANYYEKSLTNDYVENTCIDKLIQQSYKDGYEQGQKDNCETHKECQFLKYFEKENEELKKENGTLKFENHDLCEYIKVLKENEERMKNCFNCKNLKDIGKNCHCEQGLKMYKRNCDKWELAE